VLLRDSGFLDALLVLWQSRGRRRIDGGYVTLLAKMRTDSFQAESSLKDWRVGSLRYIIAILIGHGGLQHRILFNGLKVAEIGIADLRKSLEMLTIWCRWLGGGA
jgi:hypothetical protein